MGTRRGPRWLSECARRAWAGDVEAFNSLVDHLNPELIAYAERLLSAEARAARGPRNLVQVTWLAAWSKRRGLEPQDGDWGPAVRARVFKVLREVVAKAKRSAKRQVEAYEGFARAQDEDTPAGVVVKSPLDSLVRRSHGGGAARMMPAASKQDTTRRRLHGSRQHGSPDLPWTQPRSCRAAMRRCRNDADTQRTMEPPTRSSPSTGPRQEQERRTPCTSVN